MSWRIDKIKVKNFKFFNEEFVFAPQGKNVLLYGENGAGKSSLYWSVYTHYQAYAKEQEEAQKYFKAEHPQNLRNRFAGQDEDSYIRMCFSNGTGTIKDIEDSCNCYYNDDADTRNFMRKTAMASDFMNYKFLSSLFDFKNSEANEVFPLFEKEVLPYIELEESLRMVDGTNTDINNAGEWWEYIKGTYEVIPTSDRTGKFDQRTPEYKLYKEQIERFNKLLGEKLLWIIHRANAIIANEFEQGCQVNLEYTNASFNNRVAKRRFDGELHKPKVYLKASMKSDHLVDTSVIEHPKSFFNEAKITCMALALRLSILENHPAPVDAVSTLFIDDLLISLDMSIRREVIRILLSYVDNRQVFILTHDRAFFHLVWEEIELSGKKDDWNKCELYIKEGNIPKPHLILNKSPLEEAEMHLQHREMAASVNAARRAAEKELKRLLPVNMVLNANTQTYQSNLNSMIQCFVSLAKDMNLDGVAPHLNGERKLLLNPFSHDDIYTPFYRNELEMTIRDIENLSKITGGVVVDYQDVRSKEFCIKMDKDGVSYEIIIKFNERLYRYEYEGTVYYNSAKVNVISSTIHGIDCKEWGLRKLYKKMCQKIYGGTHAAPSLKNCLTDRTTGEKIL